LIGTTIDVPLACLCSHVSGLHRTYIGQIERGEKNISFGNLLKLSGVLGLTLSELLSGLEKGAPDKEPMSRFDSGSQKTGHDDHQLFEIHKLVKRLGIQRTALDRTIGALEDIAGGSGRSSKSTRERKMSRPQRSSKK
jgi:transcriptional regulator with XRE-family HTH domain